MNAGIADLPPGGLCLVGVALSGDGKRKTLRGLTLLFTSAGITVQSVEPPSESLLEWSGLDAVTCGQTVAPTEVGDAALMELTSDGQSIQFLLPTETVDSGQVAYLDQALPAWLARYAPPTPAPPTPTPAPAPPTFTNSPSAATGFGVPATGPVPPGADTAATPHPTMPSIAPTSEEAGAELEVDPLAWFMAGATSERADEGSDGEGTDGEGTESEHRAEHHRQEAEMAPKENRRGSKMAVLALLLAAIVAGFLVYLITDTGTNSYNVSPATVALGKSINLRLIDLPAG